jgi:acetoin utilization deacetylase AcuC-like enzyme
MKKLKKYGPEVILVRSASTPSRTTRSPSSLEHEDYLRIGEMIAGRRKPTLFVMEGGYAVEALA